MLQDLEILQRLMDIMKRGANPYINMRDGSKLYNPDGMWKQEIKCYKCNENKTMGHKNKTKELYHCEIRNGGKLEVPFKDSNSDNNKEDHNISLGRLVNICF